MTAAVSTTHDAAPALGSPARSAARTNSAAVRAARRIPYLTAVPDSEPPFDDETASSVSSDPARTGELPPGLARFTAAGQAVIASLVRPPRPPHQPPAPSPGLTTAHDTVLTATRSAPAGTTPIQPTLGPSTLSTSTLNPADRDALSGAVGPTTISSQDVPTWSSEADIGVRLTTSENLPPAKRSASVLARALVEVLSGRRPLGQLRVHCAPEIYAGLLERSVPAPTSLPHLLNVRVCEPADGVAEVSAVFRRADRVRALAFRMQGVDGRWRITALQLG
jgi:hypothetical protein